MFEIKCETIEDLAIICAQLVRQGICFHACSDCLIINPTGGY